MSGAGGVAAAASEPLEAGRRGRELLQGVVAAAARGQRRARRRVADIVPANIFCHATTKYFEVNINIY